MDKFLAIHYFQGQTKRALPNKQEQYFQVSSHQDVSGACALSIILPFSLLSCLKKLDS
jgi:hypothetical protein